MDAFKAITNKPFYEIFYVTFIENIEVHENN